MKPLFKFIKIYNNHLKDKLFWRILIGILILVYTFVLNYSVWILGGLIDGIGSDQNVLIQKLTLILVVIAAPIVIEPILFTIISYVGIIFNARMTKNVFSKLMSQDYSFHINKQTGKLISKVFKVNDLSGLFAWDLGIWLFQNILNFIIPIFLVSIIDYRISLILLAVLIVSFPLLALIVKINVKYRAKARDEEYARNNVITDGLENFSTVRAFGREKQEVYLLEEAAKRYAKADMKYSLSWRLVDFVSRLLGIIMFIAVSFYIVNSYSNGLITIGQIVVIISYMISFLDRFVSLFFSIRNIIKDVPIMSDIIEILEAKVTIVDPIQPKEIEKYLGQIDIDDVTFGYKKEYPVIQSISIKIKPDSKIAFVGQSGGGKTTLTKLIMRYYDPDHGSIKIDGVDIKDLKYDELRKYIGLVPQEPVLFNKSIFYNVAYGLDSDIHDEEIRRKLVCDACKKAQIHDFIESLPEKYETIIGERGLKLSGGQKQRIAIAQVLLKNPMIVIFDEATSQLDSESEKAIQKAFGHMSQGKTTIIIAHRLSTIKNVDRIYLIDNGKVREEGTHEELLKIGGIYKTLWDIQSGGFVEE
ncbi:MAG TPA: ABC transporter ATP-binding protein [Candidatus Dojkabacteria bacterium]|nr:ABC transporter ATP-binding protein [Candidatus Dojkabacteria bacterium]